MALCAAVKIVQIKKISRENESVKFIENRRWTEIVGRYLEDFEMERKSRCCLK
jgi:hypothetical protein